MFFGYEMCLGDVLESSNKSAHKTKKISRLIMVNNKETLKHMKQEKAH